MMFCYPESEILLPEIAFRKATDTFGRVESAFRQADLLQRNDFSGFRWSNFAHRNDFSGSVDQNLVIAMTISGSVEQNLINDDFSRSASAAKQEARDRSRASCLLHLVPKGGLEPPRF
jgi:hypothetical protein